MDDERMVGDGTQRNGKSGLHVLVIEDEPDNAETLALLLRMFGHEIYIARDGRTGIEAAKMNPPDVVLLDLGLPGMDGFKVAKQLRELPTPKPFFLAAMTGYGQDKDRQRTHDAGFDLHLIKPVDPQQLQDLLTRFQAIVGK
jgi:CheY-like chemotaxis protein